MAGAYWLSFRLHASDGWERTYQDRLEALHEEIKETSGNGSNWWLETTSFYIFRSNATFDQLVTRVKRAIAESVDMVVIGMVDKKGGRAVGHITDGDLYTLFPDLQKD